MKGGFINKNIEELLFYLTCNWQLAHRFISMIKLKTVTTVTVTTAIQGLAFKKVHMSALFKILTLKTHTPLMPNKFSQ